MIFNTHTHLAKFHALLSPSKGAWLYYDDDKLDRMYTSSQAAKRGTEYHNLAAEMIRLGIKAVANGSTFSTYVNDAISYQMNPEQTLFYSENCFGHADAISFRRKKLRIHDLKMGVIGASMDQLLIYAAMFCLEYKVDPNDVEIELRIYQNDDVKVDFPEANLVVQAMSQIVYADNFIKTRREEELA